MKKRYWLVLVPALGMLGAACGGSSSSTGSGASLSGSDKDAAAAVSAQLQSKGEDSVELDSKQADCVASRLVKSLGADNAKKLAGADDVPKEQAEAVYSSMAGCVDLRKMMADQMSADGEMSQKSAACLMGKITDADFKSIMISGITGQQSDDATGALMKAILPAMGQCLSTDELAKMGQ